MTDDLHPFAEEPVYQALTAPGTAAELAGEAEFLAAVRAAVPHRTRRRLAARLGAGGSVFIAAAALSGGVAAASYTGALPEPAQQVMNDVAGWAGVPAPPPHHQRSAVSATTRKKPTPVATGSIGGTAGITTSSPNPIAAPKGSPAPRGRAGTGGVGPTGPHASPTPSAAVSPSLTPTPTPTPTEAPTPTPTPTVVAPSPVALSASISATRVPANTGVTFSGRLTTSTGAPVPHHRVVVFERATGAGQFSKLGTGDTDTNGEVSFGVPALTHNVRLVLRAGRVHSPVVTVVEVPTLSIAVTPAGISDDVTVSTNGATAGDAVVLLIRRHGQWLRVRSGQLDATGTWSFTVPAPQRRAAGYRVLLKRTRAHAAGSAGFRAPPA